jgi:hypothetical protein
VRLPSTASLRSGLSSGVRSGNDLVRSVWVLGPIVAVCAAAIGYLVLLIPLAISWMSAPASEVTLLGSARLAGFGWLVAHDAAIRIADVTYTLLPWGLILIPGIVLLAATRWLGKASRITEWRRGLIAVSIVVITYSALAAVIARFTADSTASVSMLTAVLSAGAVSLVASLWGVGSTGAWSQPISRIPGTVVLTVRAGLLGFFVLLGFASILTAIVAVTGFDQMLSLGVALDAGAAGGFVLFLIQLAYIPMVIVWALSYLAGAGISLGADTLLSPFIGGTSPTQLPSAPILTLLPENAGSIAWVLPILVVLAGTIMGIYVGRRGAEEMWMMRIVIGIGATAATALLVFAVSAMSSGSWGVANLANIGPDAGLTALITWILITLGAVPVSLVVVARRARHLAVLPATEVPVPTRENHDELV